MRTIPICTMILVDVIPLLNEMQDTGKKQKLRLGYQTFSVSGDGTEKQIFLSTKVTYELDSPRHLHKMACLFCSLQKYLLDFICKLF